MTRQNRRTTRRLVWGLGLVFLVAIVHHYWSDAPDETGPDSAAPTTATESGAEVVARAFREKTSGLVVEASGTVVRILADDTKGSRHQRFLLRLEDGQTLLFAHNIDLAPRVPVSTGDTIRFRGQYEWNDRGGVIHWTHGDPGGRRPGGWIRHQDRTYE